MEGSRQKQKIEKGCGILVRSSRKYLKKNVEKTKALDEKQKKSGGGGVEVILWKGQCVGWEMCGSQKESWGKIAASEKSSSRMRKERC